MSRALCLIREPNHYRRHAFLAGLRAAGCTCVSSLTDPVPGDVLVIWNRYGSFALQADKFEAAGATVLVAENGYFGKDWRGGEWFAISKGQHNGAGSWPVGGPERWDSWGVELEPWRTEPGELVILPQRGIGPPGVAMPADWTRAAQARSGGRVREHPGQRPCKELRADLARAGAVYTWGSGAALKALLWGIPVFHDFQRWIGASAAAYWGEQAFRGDRLPMLQRLGWGMWNMDEIRSGQAFEALR